MPEELTSQQRVFRAQELYSDTVSLQRTGEDHYKSLKAISEEAVKRVEAALATAKMPTMEQAWKECLATLSPEDKKHFEEINDPNSSGGGLEALNKLDKWLMSIGAGLDVAWVVSWLSLRGARLLQAELRSIAAQVRLADNVSVLELGKDLAKTESKVAKGISAAEKLQVAKKWSGRLGVGVAIYEHEKEKQEAEEQKALIKRLGASRLYAGITSKYLGVLNDQAGMYNGLAIYLETIAPDATPEDFKKAVTSYLSNIVKKVKEKQDTYTENALLGDLETRYDKPRKSLTSEDAKLPQMQEEHKAILARALEQK
ncbi:hypothetical protein DXG01_016931 [Tephrocybe rancida]|nr:hypothetical protein DXG01_016931 [Tephrocybe rancida]